MILLRNRFFVTRTNSSPDSSFFSNSLGLDPPSPFSLFSRKSHPLFGEVSRFYRSWVVSNVVPHGVRHSTHVLLVGGGHDRHVPTLYYPQMIVHESALG